MSKVSITRSLLDDLAMSISEKSGEAVPMTLTEMKDAVDSIQTGGGGSVTQDQDGYIVLPSTGGGGGGGATQHTIHLEFSDSTDTDINVYYDDSLLGTMITAYEPSIWTYSSKTVTLAQLDGTTWYEPVQIPLNTQLIDYTKCTQDYCVDENGDAEAQQWSWISDYTPIKHGMTFDYRNYYWFYIGFYDSSKNVISALYVMNDGTADPNDGNTGYGTLSGNKIPVNAEYIRLCGSGNSSAYMSLIRTA